MPVAGAALPSRAGEAAVRASKARLACTGPVPCRPLAACPAAPAGILRSPGTLQAAVGAPESRHTLAPGCDVVTGPMAGTRRGPGAEDVAGQARPAFMAVAGAPIHAVPMARAGVGSPAGTLMVAPRPPEPHGAHHAEVLRQLTRRTAGANRAAQTYPGLALARAAADGTSRGMSGAGHHARGPRPAVGASRAGKASPMPCPVIIGAEALHSIKSEAGTLAMATANLQAIHWAGEGAVRPVVACAADALRRLQAGGPHTGSVAGADGVPKARASLCTGWPHPPLGADIAARAVPVADSGVRVAGADPCGAL